MRQTPPTARPPLKAARGFAALSLITAAFLALSGCSATPTPTAPEPRATIENIRSDAPQRAEELAGDQFQLRGLASFQQLQIPLEQPTDDAWSVVDESAFPAITRGVWNANGLRIGLLPRARLKAFMDRLPPITGMGRSQLVGSEHPSPILRTPRLRGVVDVDLTIPPMPLRIEPVTGGRLQMLARLTRDDRGSLVVDLLPHHHVPQLKLPDIRRIGDEYVVVPRDAMEKSLDGRVFDELALRADIPAGSLLVIGLYRPWPETPEGTPAPPPIVPPDLVAPPPQLEGEQVATPAPDAEAGAGPRGDDAPAEPGTPPATAPEPPPIVEAPPLPNHLGRALFAGVALGQPQQTVLLIAVEPLGGPATTNAPAVAPQQR